MPRHFHIFTHIYVTITTKKTSTTYSNLDKVLSATHKYKWNAGDELDKTRWATLIIQQIHTFYNNVNIAYLVMFHPLSIL